MIDANKSTIALVRETNWNDTPENPVFKRVRMENEGMGSSMESIQSNELDPSAAVKDLIRVGGGAQGDINTELSFGGEFEDLFEMVLRNLFDTDTGILIGSNALLSATAEKKVVGDATTYFRYPGCRMNSMAMNITTDAIITAVFNLMGSSEVPAAALIAGATYVEPNTNDVMSVPELRNLAVVGGSIASEIVFSDLSFTVNNNLRHQKGFSTATVNYPDIASKGIGMGGREVTGNMTAYFDNLELYNAFINGDAVSVSFCVSDGDGNGYAITFPKVKFSQGSVPIAGKGSDVTQDLQMQAIKDAITETDIIFFKYPLNTVVKKVTGSGVLDVDVKGDYVLTSGTLDTADAVYVRKDGMFLLKWDAVDSWHFQNIASGEKFYGRTDPDVDGDYSAEAGYGTEYPSVIAA